MPSLLSARIPACLGRAERGWAYRPIGSTQPPGEGQACLRPSPAANRTKRPLLYESAVSPIARADLGKKCVGLFEDEEEATLGIFAARRRRALHSPESLCDLHLIADSEGAVGQPHLRRSVDEEHHFVKRHLTSRWVERTFGLVGSYTSL